MTSFDAAATQVAELANETRAVLAGGPYAPRADDIAERLSGPLRVAIAGRVKAGKSTLLNALVGERLAPTDAGECTKIVTWYHHGDRYQVRADLRRGGREDLTFTRAAGSLQIDLGGRSEAEIASLSVEWPSNTLARMTLVDTPGLASLNSENSRRTIDFMKGDVEGPSDVDAVIYLMRHLHREDVAFLDAFMDRGVAAASAVNAIGVLSRADEIGAGRTDAMESAGRIAARYASDTDVSRLVSAVVPLAGLLAETGLTLTEDEVSALRRIAGADGADVERLLLGAATFCDPDATDLPVETRRALLDRLGLFGVRVAVELIRSGAAHTAADLGPKLVELSGLEELQRLVAEQFGPRARVLQARSAILSLRALARDVDATEPDLARRILAECERIEASAAEFTRIRAAHLVSSGAVDLKEAEQSELTRLLLGSTPDLALGVAAADVRNAALAGITRWRERAADPFADPLTREVCEAGARTCEVFYASATDSTPSAPS